MKGKCVDDIAYLEYREAEGKRSVTGAFFMAFGALRDIKGGLSKIFYMPTDLSPAAIIDQVNECEYPDYETKGIFRKRQEPTCRVLGEYACVGKDRHVEEYARQAMTIHVETRPSREG